MTQQQYLINSDDQRLSRFEYYFSPSISLERVLKKQKNIEDSKFGLVELGINLYYNLIIKDTLTGEIETDLSKEDRDILGVKMNLRF